MIVVAIPKDRLPDMQDEYVRFVEIHLDEQYHVEDDVVLCSGSTNEHNEMMVQANSRYFGDPDQCVEFITTCGKGKVFLSLTDKFSYLLPLIHDLSQIKYIYIYSALPMQVSYSKTDHSKLRAIVDKDSPNANEPLLTDIELFQSDSMAIKPTRGKAKLLIHEPLSVEEYMIIWIDDKDISTDCDTKLLTNVINRLEIFFNTQHCIDTIKSSSENMKIFLISSHSDVDTIVKEVVHLSNIIAIYLFDQSEQTTADLTYSLPKVVGRYSNLESLLNQLTHDYKNLSHSSTLSMSIFHREQNQSTVRDLSKDSARFIWQQLLVDILIRTPYDDQSKIDMLDECRIHYKDNASLLQGIEEFEKDYQSAQALTFYTKNSFLYRLFNQALRTENIDFLFIFRFFLADMYHQLQKFYFDQFLNNPTRPTNRLVVYRGQLMAITEFDRIKNNVGNLISVNVFLSASEGKGVAIMYSDLTSNQPASDLLAVIFEMEIDLTHDATKRPYASLEDFSQFPDEKEILLSVGSTFRILNVEDRRTSDGHWYVKMIMTEDDVDVNELRNDLEKRYCTNGDLSDLGRALIKMCDYDRAERYFRMLLDYLPENHSAMGNIQSNLGIIFANRGDYQTALDFQERALKFYTRGDPQYQSKQSIGNVYVHIGAAYRHLGQLDLALKYGSMAADIQSPTGSLAFTYNELAITHRDRGDLRLALEYFLKVLQIDEQVLRLNKNDPLLATAYNNIGEIYSQLTDYENALKYLQHALDMRLKGTVSTHTDLAAVYHNLGAAHFKMGNLKKSLEMNEKALEIDTQLFDDDHESIAASHNSIASAHLSLNDYTNALYHAEKCLRILLRSQAKDNHSLLAAYQYALGGVQYRLGNLTKALNMVEKALNNELACSPPNEKMIACIYGLFANIYEQKEDISMALKYSEKAVEHAKIWAMRNQTFELEHFLVEFDLLKKKSVNEDSEFSMLSMGMKALLDDDNFRDQTLQKTSEELERTPKENIQQRLNLISPLITIYSRQKNFSMALKYYDEAHAIYIEHQSSNMITKDQLENEMITIFYHTALCYHRQQDWNLCLSMLTKSLNSVLQQNKEHLLLPEIYYCMASCYMHRQEFSTASYYYQLTISTAEKTLPDNHSDMQRYRFQYQLFIKTLSEAQSQSQFHH